MPSPRRSALPAPDPIVGGEEAGQRGAGHAPDALDQVRPFEATSCDIVLHGVDLRPLGDQALDVLFDPGRLSLGLPAE